MTTTAKETIELPVINIRSINEYEAKAVEITKEIASLQVVDQESYERAVNWRRTLKKMESDAEAIRKTIVDPINKAKDAVQALFNPLKMRLDNSRRHVESKIDAYEQEQEMIRRAEEERLQKEAQAEEARLRKIKEEQERQWREKEEQKRKEAERLAAAGKAEEALKLQQEADKAAAKAAERALQAAEVSIVAPTIAPTIQKIEGTSTREIWSGEVTDLMALVKAIAEGKAPINFIMPNAPIINAQARATKNSLQFPGVKFSSKKSQVDRA